ncbi:BON domain-containing protein [Pedobacter caeni]|uniref:Osmotically-inducible protein OsmY, contains BON domain n=1 Tax=Pedobacter caeni TaxID=288992 RepID=A0A1M5BC96_9SPHI|nr:BON domain-containing protein [Pedobacter caeni]SHF40045.1 Osmotically-inducible protein OsmY, contains BON domain [Pedobacter caeni]
MKSDAQIQKDVMAEIKWQPELNASEIGVACKNGVVTLSGQVDNYHQKITAEKAAKRVTGVKIVAEDIQVGMSPVGEKTDAEIAALVLTALKWNSAVQEEKIKIKVENGFVKLEGEAEWEYQRSQAKKAIEFLPGVKMVFNLITLKPKTRVQDIQKKITAAFQRSASIDSKAITIEVTGDKVVLRGKVRSFAEREDAEQAAWAAPGIVDVESKLEIDIPEPAFYN